MADACMSEMANYDFGSAGLLVPDIPLEETGQVREVATAAGLELVLLTTPTTPVKRMEAIAKVSQGFVYLVSVTGKPLLPSVPPFKVFRSLTSPKAFTLGRQCSGGDSSTGFVEEAAGLHAGVTGQRTSMESRVEGLIEQLHSITEKAVAVGFGVSGPEQVILATHLR